MCVGAMASGRHPGDAATQRRRRSSRLAVSPFPLVVGCSRWRCSRSWRRFTYAEAPSRRCGRTSGARAARRRWRWLAGAGGGVCCGRRARRASAAGLCAGPWRRWPLRRGSGAVAFGAIWALWGRSSTGARAAAQVALIWPAGAPRSIPTLVDRTSLSRMPPPADTLRLLLIALAAGGADPGPCRSTCCSGSSSRPGRCLRPPRAAERRRSLLRSAIPRGCVCRQIVRGLLDGELALRVARPDHLGQHARSEVTCLSNSSSSSDISCIRLIIWSNLSSGPFWRPPSVLRRSCRPLSSMTVRRATSSRPLDMTVCCSVSSRAIWRVLSRFSCSVASGPRDAPTEGARSACRRP